MMLSTKLVGTWTAAAVDSRDLRENTVGAKSWEVAPPRDAARADLKIRRRIEQILEMQTYIYHLYLLAHLFVSWNILNTYKFLASLQLFVFYEIT